MRNYIRPNHCNKSR